MGVWGEARYGTGTGYGVYSNGAFAATGGKSFNIDHPLDPENKYLRHFSIESPEVLNMYRGTVTLDANGEAKITMPDYFTEVNNNNLSYHLTPIGSAAILYVKEKLDGNQFSIGGGTPGMEVSWMIMSERNDLYFRKNPDMRAVEVVKDERSKGKYLIPELYNQPAEKGVFYNPSIPQQNKADQPVMNLQKE